MDARTRRIQIMCRRECSDHYPNWYMLNSSGHFNNHSSRSEHEYATPICKKETWGRCGGYCIATSFLSCGQGGDHNICAGCTGGASAANANTCNGLAGGVSASWQIQPVEAARRCSAVTCYVRPHVRKRAPVSVKVPLRPRARRCGWAPPRAAPASGTRTPPRGGAPSCTIAGAGTCSRASSSTPAGSGIGPSTP